MKPSIPTPERYPAFDGLRTLCFAIVICWHALLPFTHRPRGIKAETTSLVVDYLVWLSRGLALKEFFLIAGFLAHYSYLRRGSRNYLQHRSRRLLLPCLVTAAVYNWLFLWEVGLLFHQGPLAMARIHLREGLWYEVFSARHLWFLVDLYFITVLVVILANLIGGRLQRWGDRFESLLSGPLALPLLALPTAVAIAIHDPGLPARDPAAFAALPFYPLITMFCYHLVFFAVGWLLYSHQGPLQTLARFWAVYLVAGVTFRGLYAALVFGDLLPTRGLWPLVHYVDALSGWGVVLGLLGGFYANLRVDRPLWRWLADSAYWCYLAHLFLMGEVQLTLNRYGLPMWADYLIVMAVTWPLLFLSYDLLVRYTWVGTALHGPRDIPPQGRTAALSTTPIPTA